MTRSVRGAARGRIYAICLVRDEADVIAQSLTFAAQYCERIFVLDNASTDGTWTIVKDLARQNPTIVPFAQITEAYTDALRAIVFNDMHQQLSEDDWWLILDSDEFLAEDPRPVIEEADREGANLIWAWQIQFYFTDEDLKAWEAGRETRDTSIVNRRRYYQINWQEPRIFRNRRNEKWDTHIDIKIPNGPTVACRRRIMNRHYQYRDPEQMQKRLTLRYGNPLFPHVPSADWRSEIRESAKLDVYRDGDPWRFSPAAVMQFYGRSLYHRVRAAARGGAVRRAKRLLAFK